MTFEEIEKSSIINKEFLSIFKESYINEFNNEDFDYNESKIILNKVLKLINKNV